MRVEAFANPSVIRWARVRSGLNVEEASHKAGVKSARLESWERGERRPTVNQLRKLSAIYKRPLGVFYLEEPPTDDPNPRDFRRFDPHAAEPLSPALLQVIREARARREAALELLEELDEHPPKFTLATNLRDDPEKAGDSLRGALALGGQTPRGDHRAVFNSWRSAAERAGILVFQGEDVGLEEMRGLSITEKPLPCVVLNIKDAYSARSFSLLHELAHVMLNRGGLCLFEESGPNTEVQRMEVFCNHVAGAALLPEALLLREPEAPKRRVPTIPDDHVRELARRYGASPEAVLRRFVILNRVPVSFYQQKRAEFARHRPGPRKGGFAPPHSMAVATSGQFFTRLVLEAYDEERITASDLSELLRVRLKHLERIRAAVREESAVGGHL